MKGKRYLLFAHIMLILGMLFVIPGLVCAQTFRHYEGIANKKGDYEIIDASKGSMRQKTHEYEYYVPVKKGSSAEPTLSIERYMGYASGAPLEPCGYFRWYNYDTDEASSQLSPAVPENTLLKAMQDQYGINRGLVAYNLSAYPIHKTVGVKYTRPADENWQGEDIACDVSRYIDGCNGNFEHEPTLSVRYVIHMIPAEKFADDLQNSIIKGTESAANDLTYEDNKEMSVGLKDEKSSFNIRVNFKNFGRYYFHPMSGVPIHHVYYKNEANKILDSYFDKSQLMQANAILWRVYNSDKTVCHSVWKGGQFLSLSLATLNGAGWDWYTLANQRVTNAAQRPTFDYGSRLYVVAYAYNTSNPNVACPIANFAITLYRSYPMTQEELQESHSNTRMLSYLDEHYRNVATISFDNDNEAQTMEAPTSPNDNQTPKPSKWEKRSYGFVYEELKDQRPSVEKNIPCHSPIHGEYGLYKSANVKGWSSNSDNYRWWASTNQLFDRTYEDTHGAQYGHFLYIDAADESRQIAEADFKANLCVGSQVIFSSAIAEMTTGKEKAQLLFKLYGVHYDENNHETDRKLLQSFSTGSFSNNLDTLITGKWYQGYGKMVLQKESGVGNYEDFKIVVDNLCQSTAGADYAFDDLRIYTQASKVDVIQSEPICPDVDISQGYNQDKMGNIKLKIRALQETMAALADHQEKKVFFRFVDISTGKPTTDINYAKSGEPDYQWGSTTIHAAVDNGEQMDGAAMYEKLNDEWYVNLANRNFHLNPTKRYYVSFAFDDDAIMDKNNLSWGKPSDVCSLYSSEFTLAQQTVVVTDANGTIATAVTIPCDDKDTPEYDIKAQLQTVDQNNGGTINLRSIKFNWYVDNTHGEPILKNSSEFKGIPLSEGEHTIYVEPVNEGLTKVTEGGVDYEICLGIMSFKLRAVKNGPKLSFGFADVVYPDSYERSVRLGLPQVKELAKQGEGKGYFKIPVREKSFIVDDSQNLQFIQAPDQANPVPTTTVYLSDTNDPVYATRSDMTGLKLGELQSTNLARDAKTLNMKFMPQQDSQISDDGTVQLHEGYWYEGALVFNEDGKDNTKVLCSGEAFIRFEIVPEYVTWYPTAKGQMSAAWNNDLNWVRSTRKELYKKDIDYVDYIGGIASDEEDNGVNELDIPRQNSYVPMKFSKVTIPDLSGLYFPDLGYIAYRQSNQIATKLSNAKGDEATANIQYAILAKWDANASNHGLDADGNLECEKFYGNTCDQIYFKPQAELRDQCFLVYNKAWVEKEMKPNVWYALTSPLKDVYAGDMYVPKGNGRQETEAFLPIAFSDAVNSRVNYPFYQRSWDKSDVQEVASSGSHAAYDYSGTGITFENQDLKTVTANWSHIYNKVDKVYDTFEGFALRVGDAYAPISQAENSLIRLPKSDIQYQYDDTTGSTQQGASVDRGENGRLVVEENATEGALSSMSMSLPTLSQGNAYYLVGNPYMSTLSMYYFLRANNILAPSVYVYKDGALSAYTLDTSLAYDAKNDVKIAPMQAFFVKLKDGEQAAVLNFTAGMTIDREVYGSTHTQQSEDAPVSISMQASKGNYASQAIVKVNQEASEDYDSSEDSELLYDSNLKDVPTLYTVAGDQTVAINQVPEIHWMPLGVICHQHVDENKASDNTSVANLSLTMRGVNRLDAPLYLYDARTHYYQEMEEGKPVMIQANDHGRYFLTQTRGTTGISPVGQPEEMVKVYSPAQGMIVVSSSDGNGLGQVEIFAVDGRKVADEDAEGQMSVLLTVPSSAVYIVKVRMQGSEKTIIRKLSVR